MYILRRRSDGKYFRNKGYHQDGYWHQNTGEEDPRWLHSIQGCVPFASIRGLKNSRGVSVGCPVKEPTTKNADTARAYWKKRGLWYAKANNKVRKQWVEEKFNSLYEIVWVELIRSDL